MRTLFMLLICLTAITAAAQQQKTVTVYFDFDSPQLNVAAQRKIDSLVKSFRQAPPAALTVGGYADKAGADDYNNRLAAERANMVAQAIRAALDPAINITINSYGASALLTDKDEEQNLNRRVIITYMTTVPAQPDISLEGIREDVAEQRFTINLDDTAFVVAAEGTKLKIPPGSLQTKKGMVAHGIAEVIIKEYYQPGDILLAGLQSVSPQGLLQSGGMLKVSFIQAGDTLDDKTQKPVELRMPVVNNDLKNMNVFTMDHGQDSLWNNTGRLFNQFRGYWKLPESAYRFQSEINFAGDAFYNNIKIGKKATHDFNVGGPLITFHKYMRPLIRKAQIVYIKEDSVTVKAHIQVKYRRRGFRIAGKKNEDITSFIRYIGPEYQTLVSNFRWINCDRFYNIPNKIDFYVKTPGYKATNILLYFKDIRAFMQFDEINADGRFVINKVPAGMAVTLISIGKKGSDFYLGKEDFTTSSNTTSAVEMKKVSEEDFKKGLKDL